MNALNLISKYRPTPTQISKISFAFILLTCVFYIIVYTHTPLFLWKAGMHDDGLFMELGRNLANGDWLGPYSRFTLMKGPGYPAFLAVGSWLGVSVSFMHALFHCLAVMVLAWVVFRISKSRLLAVSVFLITLWHPSMFITGRILRANIYAPQTILLLAIVSYALFVADSKAQRIKWGLLAGLIMGWYWLTREEGIWILPGFGFLVLIRWIRERTKESIKKILEPTIAMAVVCLVIQFAFAFTNWIVYDKFIGVDFKEKNFKAALSTLQSVRVGEPIPYLPVPRAVREQIYEVSPSFSTLKDFLDPPDGSPWDFGCAHYPGTCGDIAGFLMWWAIRDAADLKGYYETPEKASSFYGAVAAEVETACADGRLTCERNWLSFLPLITQDQISEIPEATRTIIQKLIDPEEFDPRYRKSLGEEKDFSKTLRFLNYPVHFPLADSYINDIRLRKFEGNWITMSGWYYDSKKGDDWFTMDFDCTDQPNPQFSMDRNKSRDIVDHFKDPRASVQRFSIVVEYRPNCRLIVSNREGETLMLKMDEMKKTTSKKWSMGTGIFYVDNSKLHFFNTGGLNSENSRMRRKDENWIFIEGWYYDSKKGDAWFKADLDCREHSHSLFRLDRNRSNDIVDHFNDPKASKQRFGILADYHKDCFMNISSSGLGKLRIEMKQMLKKVPWGWKIGSGNFFIDSTTLNPNNSDIRVRASFKIRHHLYQWYQSGFPLLVWIGFLTFMGGIPLMWKRRTWPVLFALAGACWILIAARIVILVLIHISSFDAIKPFYMLPAYLLLCVAPILSIAAVVSVTRSKTPTRLAGGSSEPSAT